MSHHECSFWTYYTHFYIFTSRTTVGIVCDCILKRKYIYEYLLVYVLLCLAIHKTLLVWCHCSWFLHTFFFKGILKHDGREKQTPGRMCCHKPGDFLDMIEASYWKKTDNLHCLQLFMQCRFMPYSYILGETYQTDHVQWGCRWPAPPATSTRPLRSPVDG